MGLLNKRREEQRAFERDNARRNIDFWNGELKGATIRGDAKDLGAVTAELAKYQQMLRRSGG